MPVRSLGFRQRTYHLSLEALPRGACGMYTVVSLEQALSMPSATLRFAQLGWRVIRIEATPYEDGLPGDPNRYIGSTFLDDDRRSYFIAASLGKESLAINLKTDSGQSVLHEIIRKLKVDVFCCNTLPSRYESLGIDYETLKNVKSDIIWAGISALGPEYPDTPGYDPVIQAMSGVMELTGDPNGPPTLCGVPLTDLKAGDEVVANVALALAERARTGQGQRIDVSMLQASASWLITTLPLLNFNPEPDEITRAGNQHRKFIPTDVFETKDGYIYLAIGNDIQWRRLVALPKFAGAHTAARLTNQGRHIERKAMYEDLHSITKQHTTQELADELTGAMIPWSEVNSVADVAELPAIRSRLTYTTTPTGTRLSMQPPPVERDDLKRELKFSPKYGEHTNDVLAEVGYSEKNIENLRLSGVIAGA